MVVMGVRQHPHPEHKTQGHCPEDGQRVEDSDAVGFHRDSRILLTILKTIYSYSEYYHT